MDRRDDRNRGGEKIANTVLLEKYQVCRLMGQKKSCQIYLCIHLTLEEYRIIKRVSKADTEYQLLCQEIHCLKQLKHPGIPIIYDLEEDASYCYLIEEYLEGETLYDLVSNQGSLQPDTVLNYGIQICELVCYLHSSVATNPILHLDIQPRNLILCNGSIKLIDFNQSATLQQANQNSKRYGTIGYAAPEQFTNDLLDERTDIFSIGAVLLFMLSGQSQQKHICLKQQSAGLAAILKVCLNTDKEKRYQTVAELLTQLRTLTETINNSYNGVSPSSLMIALTGSKSGVGTTHLAIGLCTYLNQSGYQVLYEEQNDSYAVAEMARSVEAVRNANGLYKINRLLFKPRYGRCVKLKDERFDVVIKDYGTEWEQAAAAKPDIIILLSGSQIWDGYTRDKAYQFWDQTDNLLMVYSPSNVRKIKIPAAFQINRCFRMPYFGDPFYLSRTSERFYEMLWKAIDHKKRRSGLRDFWGRIGALTVKRLW